MHFGSEPFITAQGSFHYGTHGTTRHLGCGRPDGARAGGVDPNEQDSKAAVVDVVVPIAPQLLTSIFTKVEKQLRGYQLEIRINFIES